MRHILAIISAIPLLVPDARAQSPNPGMSTQATRAMIAVSEMGRSTVGAEGSSRSLKFEEGDDPTVVAHPVPPHEPLRAARKVAEAAEHLAKKNEHQEAIAKYREAVALDPLYFEAWNNLALELQDAGTPNEAEQVFRRLMQSNPEHVLVFTNLVSLLSGQKRYVEAETVARQAMKLHGYSFKANYVLGSLLISQGKWSDEANTKLQYAQLRYPEAKSLLEHWPDTSAPN
ncbi:MAG: tetratricopeptide repeat protein [Bryobacteraceae bacterium]|jgi:tetratricopeptide (TPR) repeat protein